tara:strand:+ start:820 stop:1266 length:447 start_codon:yes stop_codon:yes gene_type:complete
MIVREAKTSDLKGLASLFNDYRVFYKKNSDLDGAVQFISERIANSDSKIFVCENQEGVLLGFVQLYPLFSSTRMKKLWLLNDLFVQPQSRSKGVSVKLIEKAKDLVNQSNASGMFLETEKSNIIGNSLYPKTGFKLNEGSNFYEWTNK